MAIFKKFVSQNKAEKRDVLGKMRECEKYVKRRDFPHDCGTVDTYEVRMLTKPQSLIVSLYMASRSILIMRHVF